MDYEFPEMTYDLIFPNNKVDVEKCMHTTELFARARLINPPKKESSTSEKIRVQGKFQLFESYVTTYPLPIGMASIVFWDFVRNKGELSGELLPAPLVSDDEAIVGLVNYFFSKDAKGWFLGLVKADNLLTINDEQRRLLPAEDGIRSLFHTTYTFTEGMVLLEGKLDESLIIQLRDFEKYYNKHILGKVVTGRPFSKETDSIIEAAKIAIKEHPLDKQLMIAIEIGYPERTLQFHIKRSKYKNWKGLHDSVINNE